MPLIILLYVLKAQHVSGTTMLIIRSSRHWSSLSEKMEEVVLM